MIKKIIKAVVVLVVICFVSLCVVAVAKSVHDVDVAMQRMPFVVITPGGFGSGPNYYCERVDQEKRIAYNCIPTGKLMLAIYPEYHLSSADSWLHR